MKSVSVLVVLTLSIVCVAGWSRPFYPVRLPRAPLRELAPPPPPKNDIPVLYVEPEPENLEPADRPKRDHGDDYSHGYDDHDHDDRGVAGPVHTFVKTDKNANYKWGVRHHVGNKYAP